MKTRWKVVATYHAGPDKTYSKEFRILELEDLADHPHGGPDFTTMRDTVITYEPVISLVGEGSDATP